jgi:hypothetical protein
MSQIDLILSLIKLGVPTEYAEDLVKFDFKAGLDLLNKIKEYDKKHG